MTTREVVLEGGSPWGFRLHGGFDTKSPLKISRVNSNGKAALKGIREGSIIASINGHSTKNLTHSDAHALVKNSGDTLILQLSEDTGSPRQRKRNRTTVHETQSETLKSTSSTLYSRTSSKTIFSEGNKGYNQADWKHQKQASIEGQNHPEEHPDPPLSPTSTISSDISSSSTLTETGDHRSPFPLFDEMDSGKSRKKRSKNQRKKQKKVSEKPDTNTENLTKESSVVEEYSVDFPEKPPVDLKLKVKSRSLDDDDDSVKIQEVTESGAEDKQQTECEAIISEADSDWEETSNLKIPHKPISLSTVAISIDEEPLQRIEALSPEEELSLRNFLESINLVDAPEICSTVSTLDTIKKERKRKREALETYFTPLVHNPRYLDIISEEGSDLSDREAPSLTQHLKQGTPELDHPPKIPEKASPRVLRKNRLKRMRLPRCQNKAVLVCTKIVDTPSVIEPVHAHTKSNIEAEKVYIESSSGSTSSDSEENNARDFPEETATQIDTNSEEIQGVRCNYEEGSGRLEEVLEDSKVDAVKYVESPKEFEKHQFSADTDIKPLVEEVSLQNHFSELTPPPTPTSSPKSKLSANSSVDLEECMKEIAVDTAKEITSVLSKLSQSCHSTFVVNQAFTALPEQPNRFYSRSSSHSSSSSRETSPSTVRLNPMNSSIADVTSILPDLELAKEALSFKQPISLRQKCLNDLLSLPCGAEILQELSDVSLNLDKLTQAVKLTRSALETDANVEASSNCNNKESISDTKMWSEQWTGLQTHNDPNVLLCLSPTQKSHLDKSEAWKNEPDVLLDLHNKFLHREDPKENATQYRHSVAITSITKEEVKHTSSHSKTLPRNFKHNNPRLEASNLGEWLRIARNDSSTQQTSSITTNETTQKNVSETKRSSLPNDLYQRQMQYIMEKEKEIERELEQLLEEKRKLYLEMRDSADQLPKCDQTDASAIKSPPPPSETFRQQMYEEYMKQVAEREDRKQHKVIKITSSPSANKVKECENSKLEAIHVTGIEDEFMKRVQELHGPLDKVEEETEDKEVDREESEPVLLMDGNSLKEATSLPKHLKEFVDITSDNSRVSSSSIDSSNGVWSPGQKHQDFTPKDIKNHENQQKDDEGIPTIWQPKSTTSSPAAERKEFRPISFESPKLSRKNKSEEFLNNSEKSTPSLPWRGKISDDTGFHSASSTTERRIPNSRSTPAAGFNEFTTPRLPRAQNPTITLLQKAREGQLPRGANYLEANRDHYRIPQHFGGHGDIYQTRRNDIYSESDSETMRKMVDSSRRKVDGVGPMTKDGLPLALRSEVRDSNQSKWYKKMYDTIHKQKPYKDEFVTVRYKQRRAQYPYITGYLSEPEQGAYDSDHMEYKYATLDRRRTPMSGKENFNTYTLPRNAHLKTSSHSDVINHSSGSNKHPGRIENYTPGHSSISDQESKRWWDEVMDIFDGNFEEDKKPVTKGYMSQALKESGYESDSTLVFRKKEEASQLSPSQQKEAYKIIQKGGDIPLHGLRKVVPDRPKEPEPPLPPPKDPQESKESKEGSPRKYVENQVTIHYKTPVRQEVKEYYSEDELAHRQQEAMKKIYQEERRRKYLQELQDMHNRRHTDNFIPSQKSPIALNRYDDFDDLVNPQHRIRARSPEPRLIAKALYNFVGMTPRELTFRKGDNIYVRRQIDKNWYEGELNAMVGLFPVNYVEIVPFDNEKSTPRKPYEGQARAKYNFLAKTHLELSLAKGEMVIITRRVDNNWYEGKIGGRKGIFPASYVDVLIDPQEPPKDNDKPIAAPAAHSLLNGSSGRESMGSHTYMPNLPNHEPTVPPSYYAKPVQISYCHSYASNQRGNSKNPVNQALHIDTQSAEPTPYKALYKYLPQNDDELELLEGDTVFVLEKCDDGWYVGSNERTGAFGTFPGNYVDKM